MIKNIEKQISEMKFEDKEQLAQFEYQVEKKFKAIEFIQVQLQGLEFKVILSLVYLKVERVIKSLMNY